MFRIASLLIALSLAGPASAQQFMELPPGTVMGNVTTHTNPGSSVTMPQLAAALQRNGLIAAQSITGDCTLSLTGVITCTQAAGNFNVVGSLSVGTKTGTGVPVFSISPTITTPVGIVKGDVGLGNVANVDTTNAANISSGALPAARMPALTGDVTMSVGTVATTLAAGSAGALNSGTLLAARMPALTGDCTTSAGAVATTCTKINGVDMTTAWTTFTPSPSCGTATFTVNSARSKTMGKTTWISVDFQVLSLGTCTAGPVSWTLPNTPQSSAGMAGRETNATGKGIVCAFAAPSTSVNCNYYDATTNFANSHRIIVSTAYENQ